MLRSLEEWRNDFLRLWVQILKADRKRAHRAELEDSKGKALLAAKESAPLHLHDF